MEAVPRRTYVSTLFLRRALTSPLLDSVLSLFGVVLIARPEFLFGAQSYQPDGATARDSMSSNSTKDVTPAQRLIGVG